VQRHGIGRPLHPSQLGSTPHDRVTSPQVRSSHSLPLDRPRQSASRRPPVVTNRPTTYRVRRDPPPSGSRFTIHRFAGALDSIHPPHPRTQSHSPSRATTSPPRFPPLEVAYAGPGARRATVMGPPSANLHRNGMSTPGIRSRIAKLGARPATEQPVQTSAQAAAIRVIGCTPARLTSPAKAAPPPPTMAPHSV